MSPQSPPSPTPTPGDGAANATLVEQARAAAEHYAALPAGDPNARSALRKAALAYGALTDAEPRNGRAWAQLALLKLQSAKMENDARWSSVFLSDALFAFRRARSELSPAPADPIVIAHAEAQYRAAMGGPEQGREQLLVSAANDLEQATRASHNANLHVALHNVLCDLAKTQNGRNAADTLERATRTLDEASALPLSPDMAVEINERQLVTRVLEVSRVSGAYQIFKLAELDRQFQQQAQLGGKSVNFLFNWARILMLWGNNTSGGNAVAHYQRAESLLEEAASLNPGDPIVLSLLATLLEKRANLERDATRLQTLAHIANTFARIKPSAMTHDLRLGSIEARINWALESRSGEAHAALRTALAELQATPTSDAISVALQVLGSLALAQHEATPAARKVALDNGLRTLDGLGQEQPHWSPKLQALAARLHSERAELRTGADRHADYLKAEHHFEQAASAGLSEQTRKEWSRMLEQWSSSSSELGEQEAVAAALQCYDRHAHRSRFTVVRKGQTA